MNIISSVRKLHLILKQEVQRCLCGPPVALAKRGHRVMTVAPRYKNYANVWDTGIRISMADELLLSRH